MTIRVYPSRLEGEPLETHETTERLSISDWMKSAAPSFRMDAEGCHPTITINGEAVPVSEWPLTYFGPTDDVGIYIEPRGIGPETWLIIAAVAMSATALYMASNIKMPRANQSGTSLEDAQITINRVRWGDPVPEIAGSPLIYPDYLMPHRRHYIDKTQQWFEALVCVGMGSYQKDASQVFIGETSGPSLGNDFEIQFFEPGETIPAPYNEWWHTPEEVGFTNQAGAGLTLSPEESIEPNWGSAFTFSNQNITADAPVPDSWEPGMQLRVVAEHEITFSGNAIESAMLDTLGLTAGDSIELTGESEGVYEIDSITPGSGGSLGSASSVSGSAPPTRLDFGVTPATLIITIGGLAYIIYLSSDELSVSDLVDTMNAKLAGVGAVVSEGPSGELVITQLPPFNGLPIALAGDIADLMGSPTYVTGTPQALPSGTRYYVSGAYFGNRTEIAAAGRPGFLYSIIGISGNSVTVAPAGVPFWTGFPPGISDATSFVELDPGSMVGGWIGPFTAVPPGELADAFEVDNFFPQGLFRRNSKGNIFDGRSSATVAWRFIGDSEWNYLNSGRLGSTTDQIGFTQRVDLPSPGRVEVMMRLGLAPDTPPGVSSFNDAPRQWTGLRARLLGAPASYPSFTTAHIRLRSGDKISATVENKLAIRAMRILPTVEDPEISAPTRDIAPFFLHMMGTVGYGRDLIDMPKIEALHGVWQSRGDTFDIAVNGSSTLKTVANYCLGAGFSELTLHRGKISAVRDSMPIGPPTRIYSPQELTAPIVESSETAMPDDVDGVDIDYVDYASGRKLTASYRLPGDQGLRVQKIQAPGVTSRTRAWRIAARARRTSAYRRTSYKGQTELAAMNSYYWDYIGLQDGIPEYGQSAFVLAVDGLTLYLSEEIRNIDGDPIIMFRRPDGTATDPVAITVIDFDRVVLDELPPGFTVSADPNEPTIVYLGSTTQVFHRAHIISVTPSAEGRVEFQAVNVDNRVYDEDDNQP